MKSIIKRIFLVFVCTVLAIDVNAQKPIWVVGHACNSRQCLLNTLSDGGCGVEVDLWTDYNHKKDFWAVAHDGFIDRDYMNNANRKRSTYDHYVSLDEYLKFPEMNQISILWLDVKGNCGDYLIELVKHVHAVLKDVYPNGKIPYSIIYGLYKIDALDAHIPGTSELVIDWLRDNLYENEGINLAFEGKNKTEKYGSGFFGEIEDLMTSHRFPINKHFMTCGFGASYFVYSNSVEPAKIIEAKKMRSKGRYCSKIGFWTCATYKHAIWFIEPSWADVHTECDLVLVECRNEFKAPGDRWAVWKLVEYFFKPGGDYYSSYNKGRYRIANQNDVFYKMP